MVMRYKDGWVPNLLAFAYVIGGYAGGWLLFFQAPLLLNFAGIILLAHSMVIAAYLIHECAHNTIFFKNQWNANLGRILMWFTGACYGTYEEIRHKHFRHHMDRADVVAFDYRPRLAQHHYLMQVIKWLEWFYIPAVEIIMHLLVLVLPFTMENRCHKRTLVLMVLLVRITLFSLLALAKPSVLIMYTLAYLLFLTIMRFMDVHQHTYEIFETLDQKRGEEAKRFDASYEQRNTFSNVISLTHPWLNLLVLNFGYHNAHHHKPIMPWYRLPALHREMFGQDSGPVLPFRNLLKAYHEFRVPRILNEDEGDVNGLERGRRFVGVDGVSFLTAH